MFQFSTFYDVDFLRFLGVKTPSGGPSRPVASSFVPSKSSEREIQELKSREADLHKALQAKDSQLAVLRVRFQDADQQLQTKAQRLHKLEQEQERYLTLIRIVIDVKK